MKGGVTLVKAAFLLAGVGLIAYGMFEIYRPLCPLFVGVAALWIVGQLHAVSK